jgi:5,10-methylene-tetrahydrofolate dehydrogenase/methenyl tetrahydrofolate cyclohydrolase
MRGKEIDGFPHISTSPHFSLGKQYAEEIRQELRDEISEMNRKPCLAILQVGSSSECNKSVNIKKTLCQEVGILTLEYVFEENVNEMSILQTG